MGVGTSLGAYYEDDTQHSLGIQPPVEEVKPKEENTRDKNVLTPKGLEGNKNQATDPDLEIPITNRIDVYQGDAPSQSSIGVTAAATLPKKDLPDFTNDRPHDWVERMGMAVNDAVQTTKDIMTGKTPMWAMDPQTGEFHTSPEGIEAGLSMVPYALGGTQFPTIHLRGPAHEALQEGPDAFQQFMATRGRRQESTRLPDTQVAPEANAGHPMDPVTASNWYHELYNGNHRGTAMNFAHEYEDMATPEQFGTYVDQVSDPAMHPNSNYFTPEDMTGETRGVSSVFRQEPWRDEDFHTTIEHNPGERIHYSDQQEKFQNAISEASQSSKLKLIKDDYLTEGTSTHQFKFVNDKGSGSLSISERQGGRELYVNWAGIDKKAGARSLAVWEDPYVLGPQTFGTNEIKSLLNQVKEEFPKAEFITGFRVSGARLKTGMGSGNAKMRIRPKSTNDQ